MTVQDLWHTTGTLTRCADCRQKTGPRTARHGRGRRWRVVVPGHPSKAFTVKADAIEWERRLWDERPTSANDRVEDLVKLWLDGKRHLTPRAFLQCRDAAQRATNEYGHRLPSELGRGEVQAWVSGLTVTVKGETRPASRTIRSKALQALAGALRIAVETGQVDRNVADEVRIPKAQRRPARFLEPAELARLADASDWPAAIWLLGTGGFRISEALALTVGSIDARRKRAHVQRSKSGRERDVPLVPRVLDMLDLERPKREPLLVHPRGNRMRPDTFRWQVVLPAARRAGIEGLTTHDLRHTAASLAIRSGADVKMVQEMLGHASAAMTLDLYGHLFHSGLDDVATRMEELFETE